MTMMATPATWSSPAWWSRRSWPMPLAVAPSATKTRVKPLTNSSVARSTLLCSARVATARSVAPTPDMRER